MRRWLAVAALGAALIALPSVAQRGGGGHGGGFGGHAGFASHPMGGGFHAPAMARGYSGVHFGTRWGNGFHNGYPHNGYCWNGRCYYRHYYGYPWAYGYWPYSYGWGWPYYGYDDYDQSDYQQASNNYYPQDSDAPQAQAQIDRLSDEVARLNDQLANRNVPRPPQEKESAPEPTQLVFADKHTEQVENYAIVRQTLWVFDGDRTRKIPLANLDLPATEKANEDRGVEFEIPN
jgi:hypothetical protein